MDKKLYVLLALFFPLFLSAQTNYKPGVIVDSKGDTLRGLIDYREWVQNPESIDFKYKVNSVPQHLGTKAVQYFGINGYEYYRRYTVNISLNTTELQQLSAIPDTTSKTATVFLKILQTGKNASLFSYTDNLKQRFYIADNTDGKPEELHYLLYLNPDNNDNLVTRRLYQGQLSVVAGNHQVDVSGDLAATQYDERSLVKIVSKINGGQNKLSVENKQSSIRFYAGLTAGINTLKFSGNNTSSLLGSTGSAFSPQLNFGFDTYLNPNVGRFVLRVELSVSSSNYNNSSTSMDEINGTTDHVTQQLDQYDIALSPMIIYNFYNAAALKAYLGVGLKENLPLYPTNKNTSIITSTNSSSEFNTTVTKYQMESSFLSVAIKAGLVINRNIDIYIAYCPSASITNYLESDGDVTSYQVGLNYIFGK